MYKIVHVASDWRVFGIFFFPLFRRAVIDQVAWVLNDKLSPMERLVATTPRPLQPKYCTYNLSDRETN